MALFAAAGVFAAAVALVSAYAPERAWGTGAAGAYAGAAALLLLRRPAWRAAVVVSFAGALVAPLAWLASTGQGQPEVSVIIRSASLLLRHGTPYLSPAAITASGNVYSYDPYLPLLAVFGIPRALGVPGLLGDPRLWFAAVFAALLALALARAGQRPAAAWTALIMASPMVAFPLVVGGDDLPPLGLVCLGLALLHGRSRPAAAGLMLGLAAAMKATAWPALPVVAALIAARDGRRALAAFAAAALTACAALTVPFAAAGPSALVANTILFPLGLTRLKTPAASVLPGHLLAQASPDGRWVAAGLLAAAALGMAGWLAVRPPRDAAAAAWRLAAGLTLLFALAPASRFGYFAYPLVLAAWAGLASAARWHRHLPRFGPVVLRDLEADDPRGPGKVRRERLLRLLEVAGLRMSGSGFAVAERFGEDVFRRVRQAPGPAEP